MPGESDQPNVQPLERKLATILSADVAEFSRLMSEDEEGTLLTFRGHKQVFESLVAAHRGRIFNTAGDAILAEFSSAVEAVRCATDIQTALRTRNDKLAPNRQVRFRIGINLGDVLLQGQDLLGDGVNVAALLQTAAEPGGVCISGSVHDQIRNKLSLSFQSLGERSYKNIAQPIRTFSVLESENGNTLPAPKPVVGGGPGKWIAAATVVVVVLAGAYWGYSHGVANKPQPAVAVSPPTQAATSPPQTAPAIPPAPAANSAAPPAAAPPNSKPADKTNKSSPPAVSSAAAAISDPAPSPAAVSPITPKVATPSRSFDGAYAGQVCFEATKREPSRCFHGEGNVVGAHITGKWPMGKDTGVTKFLEGDVSPAGEVKMEMHTEKEDGSRVITVDFTGTIHDIHLDATGKFRMGRAATLNWHKNPRATRAEAASQP